MAETRNAMRAGVSDGRALPPCKEKDAYVPDAAAAWAPLAPCS
jgi:hypothetical protein